jgi:bifunctional non-homologous end joining protein LigD
MRARSSSKKATAHHHPAEHRKKAPAPLAPPPVELRIPRNVDTVDVLVEDKTVRLTNLRKLFWPDRGITKGDLIQFYTDMAPVLLPHLADRAMVMKRYPNGIQGKWFFMKRTPSPRPEWLETCEITHKSNNVIAFPMVQDLAALLWVINLGCIDLNPWYARCDDVDRPDYLHFDLDPVEGADFDRVRETALILRDALQSLGMKPLAKTSGSKGIHVYVPIVRRPVQTEVWRFAKALAKQLEKAEPAGRGIHAGNLGRGRVGLRHR